MKEGDSTSKTWWCDGMAIQCGGSKESNGDNPSIPFLAMDKNHWWFPIGPG